MVVMEAAAAGLVCVCFFEVKFHNATVVRVRLVDFEVIRKIKTNSAPSTGETG
jgi:hypothetical protein